MAKEIEQKHKLGRTIQDSNFGRGHAWLFEGDGNPSTGTASEIQKLNDINAPIGSKFLDLVSGESYVKIDTTPDEERGSYKVGAWQLSAGGTSTTDQTIIASFAPSGSDSTNFICDSSSDIVVTIDTGALTTANKAMSFYHKGTGGLSFINGSGTLVGSPLTSFVSEGTGSTIYIELLASGEYNLYGQTA